MGSSPVVSEERHQKKLVRHSYEVKKKGGEFNLAEQGTISGSPISAGMIGGCSRIPPIREAYNSAFSASSKCFSVVTYFASDFVVAAE
jgi:hypothetical protein